MRELPRYHRVQSYDHLINMLSKEKIKHRQARFVEVFGFAADGNRLYPEGDKVSAPVWRWRAAVRVA